MDNKFILPVSIEEFAAYLDKNLSQEDTERMNQIIDNNRMLKDICDINSLSEDTYLTLNERNATIPDEIENMSFEMPNLDNCYISDDFFIDDDINQSFANSINIETDQVRSNVIESSYEQNSANVNFKLNDNMATQIQTGKPNFGETGLNIKDPIFIHQPDDHSCALRSQQIVLRDFGIDIPFKDLEQIAKENGVYSDNGTLMYDVGKVLDIAGVGMHQVVGSNILELTNELSQGHRVIVDVDANELWYNDSLKDKLTNWFHDFTGQQGGNHALIVAGIEVNQNNPQDVNVVLTDPGSGDLRIEYPMNQFMDAWKDSNCFMAATDNPAPFQYDPTTGMEVPSNFVMEQHFNQFVSENSYQLSPDLINVPEGYQPAYSGHLDFVGDEEYDVFKEKYDDYRLVASSLKSEQPNHQDDDDNKHDDDDDDDNKHHIDDDDNKHHIDDDDDDDDDNKHHVDDDDNKHHVDDDDDDDDDNKHHVDDDDDGDNYYQDDEE